MNISFRFYRFGCVDWKYVKGLSLLETFQSSIYLTNFKIMIFSGQFLQFLRLSIVYFKIELLVLIGDQTSLDQLVHIQNQFDNILPTIIVSISSYPKIALQSVLSWLPRKSVECDLPRYWPLFRFAGISRRKAKGQPSNDFVKGGKPAISATASSKLFSRI